MKMRNLVVCGTVIAFTFCFAGVYYSLVTLNITSCTSVAIIGRTEPTKLQENKTMSNWTEIRIRTFNQTLILNEGHEDFIPQLGDTCRSTEEFLKENELSLKWIEEHCNKTMRSRLSHSHELFYFRKSNLGWCPVYKAASSNVLSHFCNDYFPQVICLNKSRNGANNYRQSTMFMEDHPSSREMMRFTVARNPLRRLLSAYRDKLEQLRERSFKKAARDMMLSHRPIRWNINFYKEKGVEVAIKYAEAMASGKVEKSTSELDLDLQNNPYLHPPYPTFREFVSAVIAGWGNPHIVPASQYCGPCGKHKFDFLLKAETFSCDMESMLNATSNTRLAGRYKEKWATNRGPPLNTTTFLSYYSTLTTHQLHSLLHYYQDDCLLYQYKCREMVENIKSFQLFYPDHRHVYDETWAGNS